MNHNNLPDRISDLRQMVDELEERWTDTNTIIDALFLASNLIFKSRGKTGMPSETMSRAHKSVVDTMHAFVEANSLNYGQLADARDYLNSLEKQIRADAELAALVSREKDDDDVPF